MGHHFLFPDDGKRVTSAGVQAITEFNAEQARKRVEELMFKLADGARQTWIETGDELQGYVYGFLLEHPEIHNALVPKEASRG